MIKSLKWMGVRTDRYQEMREFYSDKLGLELFDEESDYVDFLLPNGDRVELFAPGSIPDEPLDTPVMGLEVEDVDQARRHFESRGVEFIGPVRQGKTLRWTYFRAPDGHVYELVGPAK
ncbi:MAG TPA: VOC family protein [Acidobacteriota bacterium]|nr:VOC family protein [Acidobacteriota bacterium]